jgi:hypothetical protein
VANAILSFLPWVRQGAAGAIGADDTLGAPGTKLKPVATVAAELTLNGGIVPAVDIKLRGPGDVIGIDPSQIVRTDPRAATNDFEPNCFPAIEFDRADFPWLFTPARAKEQKLRPWLCLVVVRKQPGVIFTSTPDAPLPSLRITSPARPALELPELKESWAWAHSQVAASDSTKAALDTAFGQGPELTLSRLLCPRDLAHDTEYIACVVPTFDLGRKAGLGLPITEAELRDDANLTPAWVLSPAPAEVLLPVYYSWEFRTGAAGDFEALARRLKAGVPGGIGKRTVDIHAPGFDAAGATTIELEGALLPIGAAPTSDPIPAQFKDNLAAIVNEPNRSVASTPNADPLLAPPLYGRWHAARAVVSRSGTTWLDHLNLDPRWRVAAAFGTRVIQEHQEALMASAWQQAAELEAANQRMRQLQLSMAIGERLHQRHFASLSEERVLRIVSPAFGRLKRTAQQSILAWQSASRRPVAANRAAMRRIGRLRGPLTRRIVSKGFPRSATDTWVARLNFIPSATPTPPPPIPPPFDLAPFTTFITPLRQRVDSTHSSYGTFTVASELATITQRGSPFLDTTRTEVPDLFRAAAREHLARVFPVRSLPQPMIFSTFQGIRELVLEQIRPRTTLAAFANAVVMKSQDVLGPTAPGVTPIGVETVMTAPYFPQAMSTPLHELAQEWLLPGIDRITPDTVLGLKTNRRFIEAYLVGLNHEMGRELLWRGYPTDQRGTYFDRFWGFGAPNSAAADILPLHGWRDRALGSTTGAPPARDQFVLLLRSVLLQRYPNASIFLAPAKRAGTGPDPNVLVPDTDVARSALPVFGGTMDPDIAFFGFPVTVTAAIGDGANALGYYVVIQEHPTEPRFGLDESVVFGSTHVSAVTAPRGVALPIGRTWGKNSAEMAAITRRLPVRMAIHAARLIAPN